MFKSENMKYVGRIDYLGRDRGGKTIIGESIQYKKQDELIKDLKDDLDCGRPVCLVLYKDEDGNVMPKDFIMELNSMPSGYAEEVFDPNKNYSFSER